MSLSEPAVLQPLQLELQTCRPGMPALLDGAASQAPVPRIGQPVLWDCCAIRNFISPSLSTTVTVIVTVRVGLACYCPCSDSDSCRSRLTWRSVLSPNERPPTSSPTLGAGRSGLALESLRSHTQPSRGSLSSRRCPLLSIRL